MEKLAEKKVSTQHLKLGMFVSQLDRPWLDTPFLMQGFHIGDDHELSDLRLHCKYVYIDESMGERADHYIVDLDASTPNRDCEPFSGRKIAYEDVISVEQELPQAKHVKSVIAAQVASVMDDVRVSKKISYEAVHSSVTPMIESIVRNPDAFLWLTKLKSTDDYNYNHAIDSCALALAFGRHLGLTRAELDELAVGALLFDVGKTRLPWELLNKPERLTAEELQHARKHVLYSVDLMTRSKRMPKAAIEMSFTHHERQNGSGYPRGLQGDNIPIFGAIAALVDSYDAMTSERPYAEAISSQDAIKKLYEWRNTDFREELVEQFIQCLGVYPLGTVVELSNGAVGIVVQQNRVRRLRPKLMLVLDQNKKSYDGFPTIDLLVETTDKHGDPLDVVDSLPAGSYGIDPKMYFL